MVIEGLCMVCMEVEVDALDHVCMCIPPPRRQLVTRTEILHYYGVELS